MQTKILTSAVIFLLATNSLGWARPDSVWTHNGSLMSLDLAGDQLRFAYIQPRRGMIDAGARPGSQLFDGRLQGTRISGVARIFSWKCGQFAYQVHGEISSNGSHVTLTGSKPMVDRATCLVKGSTLDVLNFDLNSGAPIASGGSESVRAPLPPPTGGHQTVPMLADGGTFKVPVTINGQLTLDFIVDSGAADVSIPADVVLTLVRTGTLAESDFLDSRTYRLADGSTIPSQRFLIRSLKVGDKVLENITGSVAPVAGSLLLGQSFLTRFKSWSIDNQRQALVLN
jgi:clan AA aspartic protease (TIGR02281 family)